jgi:hypothetical protein
MKAAFFFTVFLFLGTLEKSCAQGLSGTGGLFNIPVAYLLKDRQAAVGAHFLHRDYASYKYGKDKTYQWHGLATFATVAFLPRVEFQFRYTHLLGREISSTTRYFPDRMLSFRFLLLQEGKRLPALTLGLQDQTYLLGGAGGYYASNYVVASKTLRNSPFHLQGHLGYGLPRLAVRSSPSQVYYEGLFGGLGLRWVRLPGAEWMLEYDSQHWNTGVKVVFFKHWQVLAGLHQGRGFSGGVCWRGYGEMPILTPSGATKTRTSRLYRYRSSSGRVRYLTICPSSFFLFLLAQKKKQKKGAPSPSQHRKNSLRLYILDGRGNHFRVFRTLVTAIQ